MKKSLIALAVLGAFAGAASAQSSVTLYGLIDLNYQNVKAGDAVADVASRGQDINRLSDGHVFGPGSRWGLRVAEDLGSGLKANVVLESGLNGDDGTSNQGGRLFGRQAFVSLASAVAGEVRLGRQYTLHDEVQLLTNPFGNATFLNPGAHFSTAGSLAAASVNATTAGARGALPMFIDNPRIDNSVQYISPSFAGFRLQGLVAAGEGTAGRYQGLKGVYAQGPLNVALSYEDVRKIPGVTGTRNKIVELGGNYDFGVAKVFAGYQQAKDLTAGAAGQVNPGTFTMPVLAGGAVIDELKAFTVGASVPFGAITVGANYTRAKYDLIGGGDRTLGRAAVGATYALSKLTTIYAAGGVANGDLKDNVLEKRVVQIGLRKAF